MGRPKLPESEKRTERVNVYLTPPEKEALAAYAAESGLSMSDYLHRLATRRHRLDELGITRPWRPTTG